jgi:uncharacterized protein YdbL (DUF1318 family)
MHENKWIARPRLSKFSISGLLLISASLGITGCVTVNVNIPEGAVQQASDDYVRELYEAKEKGKNPNAPATPGAGSKQPTPVASPSGETRVVKTDSPEILKIKDRMKARRPALKTAKEAGLLGETKDGMLVLKGNPAADQLEGIKKIISDENKDRTALYKEILSQNGMSKAHLTTIENQFAHTFQKYSPSNTWMQDDDGSWSQKP